MKTRQMATHRTCRPKVDKSPREKCPVPQRSLSYLVLWSVVSADDTV
jgi:hypothetical protein